MSDTRYLSEKSNWILASDTATLPMHSQQIVLRDERILSYSEYGRLDGFPLFAFHGMPGSRFAMQMIDRTAHDMGLRIIAPERPGYGYSSPHRPHHPSHLLSFAGDITQLADVLGVQYFSVMGVSGGGAYALACAYTLPERLRATLVVSGMASLKLPDSLRKMYRVNRVMFTLARYSPALFSFLLPHLIRSSLPSMEKHVQAGTSPSPNMTPSVFAMITDDQREAIRQGGQGLLFDTGMLWKDWGFRLEDIRTKVHLWHGEADTLAPTSLARYLANHIPSCEATFYPDEDHGTPLIEHTRDVLSKALPKDIHEF